jgi:hypothetical protein
MNILSAQEMQLSGGLELGFGVFKVNNDFWFPDIFSRPTYNENSSSVFFAPGLSALVRKFQNVNNKFSMGFVFRGRVIFVTNYKQTGTVSITYPYVIYPVPAPEKISETYSIADDDFFIGIMDFGIGSSVRYMISDRLQFYIDLGINGSIADFEDYDTTNTLNYLGTGIFSGMALQVNLRKTMYLEFGMSSIMNVISRQEGTYNINNQRGKYEDSGKWDLMSVAVYIHIGRRFDLNKLRREALEQMKNEIMD